MTPPIGVAGGVLSPSSVGYGEDDGSMTHHKAVHMSGGAWNYKQYHIEELADNEIPVLLKAVAITEHEADWAESCDTSRESAMQRIYELWVHVFNCLYDDTVSRCPLWLSSNRCPVKDAENHMPFGVTP